MTGLHVYNGEIHVGILTRCGVAIRLALNPGHVRFTLVTEAGTGKC